MSNATTAAFTTEFHRQFQADTSRLLRHRFLCFTAVVAVLAVSGLGFGVLTALLGGPQGIAEVFGSVDEMLKLGALVIPWLLMYLVSLLWAWRGKPKADAVLRASIWIVAADGVFRVLSRSIDVGTIMPGLGGFMMVHILACMFIPWTPKQAVRPVIMVLVFSAAMFVLIEEPIWLWEWNKPNAILRIIGIGLTPFVGLPGTFICWFRHSRRVQRFKIDFLQSRYGEVRRELVDAKRIHESLFPERVADGSIRLNYTYEPARAIGGDFLYARMGASPGADPSLSVVLIDVTGHGIPAALTVNRLHGELDRVFAENPDVSPGEVLSLLNRYVHLTLSGHSIYATAMCLRAEPGAGKLRYASGGHPPAFVRAVDGTIDELESTSFVLGACAAGDFDAGEATVRFGPGDSVVAYTDGAIEARDADGRMIRIDGMRKIIASSRPEAQGMWPDLVRSHVERHRLGIPEDDTLIVELFRPLPDATSKPAPRSAAIATP